MAVTKKRIRKKATAVRVSASCKPVDAEQLRQKVRNMVANQAYEMTRVMIGEVVDGGSVTAMRYLFELAGLHPLNVEMGEPEEQESLAKTLLDRLGLPAVPGGEPQPL
jgi:hypothetical protein